MIEIPYKDLFNCPENTNQAICINTNNTQCYAYKGIAMARGLELKADQLYDISGTIFYHIINNGNIPCDLGIKYDPMNNKAYRLLTFPVKNEMRDPCDKELIIKSAKKLVEIANIMQLEKIYLVRPGYGKDLLDYDESIRPELQKILDDRFYILDYLLN